MRIYLAHHFKGLKLSQHTDVILDSRMGGCRFSWLGRAGSRQWEEEISYNPQRPVSNDPSCQSGPTTFQTMLPPGISCSNSQTCGAHFRFSPSHHLLKAPTLACDPKLNGQNFNRRIAGGGDIKQTTAVNSGRIDRNIYADKKLFNNAF